MTQDLVVFKGTQDGVYIYIREGSFDSIKEELDIKLRKSGAFFKGGKIVDFKGKRLSSNELEELKDIVKDKHHLKIVERKKVKEKDFFTGIKEGMTKFVKTTLRSGQSIEYKGNVVIFGDVNPGSIVISGGNIVVLGSLRGVAHAGCSGNKNAIVAAFSLQPSQLRIADLIARRPDEDIEEPKWPEIARIEGNEVIIERYLPKK
ncbi:septum site-determining protein MinC [Anaerosalibacter massiliensis]|uniref:Probable septum site-determining protein MinC n=1 Tax=Anaerosalibacter massiliensis TaxID=1347392 RepID=A0A9X2MJZ1_9FIRM|nr:septum site-determining protein MinC [Anaerosalibacter massiliensis]MCR2045004.1 septum site-determining protein MinC [Anaerosalibacter massiliensis]